MALLGIAVATRNGKQAQDKLKASWELAIATGNGAVALQAACRGVEFAIRRAVGLTELSIDQLELLSGGFQLRDREAFEDAKRWLNEARRWHEALGAKTYDAPLQMAEAQVLRLEGRAKDAIDVLVSSLDDSHGLSRSAREAGIGLLYFKDLGRPDLALPFLERALADREQVASTLRGQAHRLGMRDETAQLSIWTIDCALALGETERAFAVLERGKALELRRLLGLDSQEAVSAPTLAEVAHRLEGRQAAFVCFTLSPQSARAFVATPGKVHDPLEIPLGLEQLSKLWLSLQETYGKARSPAAAFDTRLVGDWHRELQRACTVIGSALASGVVALLEEHGTKELILVPQTMLHAFPLHAAVLPDGTTMADRFVTGYAVSATEFLGRGREPVRGAPAVCVAFADSLGDLPLAQFETTLPNAWRLSQETYLGGEVTKDRIIAKLAEADWLHFACHARHVLADNDMTGIYVADAADDGEGRGILSLRSIVQRARLRKGSVVVLSGCETGAITPRLSDEYVSLAGGFIGVGASAVIASMWKVRDSAAILLMRRLYAELDSVDDVPRALHAAQVWLRELSSREARNSVAELMPDGADLDAMLAEFEVRDGESRPFAHIADWGAFQIIGSAHRQ